MATVSRDLHSACCPVVNDQEVDMRLLSVKIVLYGWRNCPELLCCAAGLLRWGFPASNLLLLDPDSPVQEGPQLPTCFGDQQVQ